MITRSKLVEQLRDYQIRSQQKFSALTVFSPKPNLTSRTDVAVAIFWALVFSMLVVSSYVALYFRHFRLSFVILCFGVFLPLRLRISRHALAKKSRERKLLLPLSM
ncbi:NADH-ubiquinone oxidoreductase chain [Trema orientale]|uniref:NADH-ubiquinone oxidoreductase chain n=1 Tax=Trema orientale TaxID=63057 RepID=A0A2P5FXM3_TREOI|nr:NADH-ubiquinone oxidoreductase chain [Trema orientale]